MDVIAVNDSADLPNTFADRSLLYRQFLRHVGSIAPHSNGDVHPTEKSIRKKT
jgi:hypothetical protein